MRKIPMLLDIEFDNKGNRTVLNKFNPAALEVLVNAEAVVPTFKKDGTAVMLDDEGNWFARRAVKPGKKTPAGFVEVQKDNNTGKSFGWEPAENSSFAKFLRKAITNADTDFAPGTYELVGPKINGNPEGVAKDTLLGHGEDVAENFPAWEEIVDNKDDIIGFVKPLFEDMKNSSVEGIVFWADNVPAVKLRVVDIFPEMDTR